ncbi:MAG: hypothetical protein NW226_10115, partial [Microscillaceae bacterium]|nr:hypothetical protein [Microscillaceae bacterium]
MQIPLHKNNDPTHIRIQPKKQDTIQKKTNDPNKKPFQKSLEPPKNNPFLQALMPPQQNVDRPKQVISTPDTSIQQAEDQLQDKSTDTAFHTYKKHDPADKKLIIFINGFWGLPTLACCGGAKDYWGKDGWWAQAVQDRVGDWNDWYFDGSSGGSAALAWQFYERLLPGHP